MALAHVLHAHTAITLFFAVAIIFFTDEFKAGYGAAAIKGKGALALFDLILKAHGILLLVSGFAWVLVMKNGREAAYKALGQLSLLCHGLYLYSDYLAFQSLAVTGLNPNGIYLNIGMHGAFFLAFAYHTISPFSAPKED